MSERPYDHEAESDFDPDPDHESHRRGLAELQGTLDRGLAVILERLDQLMSDFTALDAVVADLTTTVTAVEAEVATLTTASTADQPSIDAAVSAIGTALTSLKALVPAPPPPPPVVAASLYTFAGDPTTIDASQWVLSSSETTDVPPKALYTFTGDVAVGDTLGNGLDAGAWVLYAGPVQPAVPVAGE